MARRVSLPAADDLFRPTADPSEAPRTSRARTGAARAVPVPLESEPGAPGDATVDAEPTDDAPAARPRAKRPVPARRSSGRVKHDEKMTVYVTSDELLELEHARLTLRRDLGMAVDRGRIVREAIALALEDIEAHGEESALVRRLLGE